MEAVLDSDVIDTDMADLEQEKSSIVTLVRNFQIANAEDFTAAAEQLKTIKGSQKRVNEFFDPMIKQADQTTKDIRAKKRAFSDPLDQSEGRLKQLMLGFQQVQQRKAEDERRRLQAEADERARKEREALEKKAAAAKKPETQERHAEAAAMVVAPVIHVASEAPKVAGISTRKIWRARVVNLEAVPREFMLVDEKKLAKFAAAMKEGAKVEGVEFYTEDILSSGSN